MSTHRYQYGEFWPNLAESDFDYIGEGDGRGYNVNIPLNKVRNIFFGIEIIFIRIFLDWSEKC